MSRHISFIIVCALLAAGCGRRAAAPESRENHESHAGHDHSAADGHEGHDHSSAEGHDHSQEEHATGEKPDAGGEIFLSREQTLISEFEVQAVSPAPFSQVIRTSGQILSAQGDWACLSSPAAGIVTLGAASLSEGGRVSAGQTLFYISSKNLATGDLAAKARANYLKTKAEWERLGKLVGDGTVSRREYEAAEYEYLAARSEWEAIAPADGRGIAVKAPLSGYVVGLQVHQGDYVELGAVLANVARERRLQLRAEVSQRYYGSLAGIVSARIRAPYSEGTLSLSEMNGRLLSVGQATPASGYMIPVIFEFDNPGGVVAGSWVEVWLLGTPREEVISLPVEAVTEQGGIYFVYVQVDEEGYLRRRVETGARDGERVAILSGLERGERVVVRGAAQVRMAAMSGTIPHGHSH